jgi:hypothetical protein
MHGSSYLGGEWSEMKLHYGASAWKEDYNNKRRDAMGKFGKKN